MTHQAITTLNLLVMHREVERRQTMNLTDQDTPQAMHPRRVLQPATNGQVGRQSSAVRVFRLAIGPISVALAVVGIWYFISYVVLTEGKRFLMPPPHETFREGFLKWENLEELLQALWRTTQVSLVGLTIAFVLGMSFAILMSQAKWVERSFYPWAVVVQTVPILALVPLIGFWFGFNFQSRVIICVIIALFPIIINTLFGLQSVQRPLHDLFTLHDASRFERLWRLQLPHALPSIFTGLRTSAGLSVIGAIVGEFFFRRGEPGLGRLLDQYRARLQSELLFSTIFWSSILGISMFALFGFLGHLATGKWSDTGQAP